MTNHNDHINLIWQIADLLRGPYRPPQYERVMLPMTVLRRFDCVLAPTKAAVLAKHENLQGKFEGEALDAMLNNISKQQFHNHSPLTFEKLKGAPQDQFAGETFDYLISNPPFGVDWKKQQSEVSREHEKQGYAGRFGAGLPRVNDGALLFLQHMIAKFDPVDIPGQKYGICWGNNISALSPKPAPMNGHWISINSLSGHTAYAPKAMARCG